jgi:hypothetical protein
MKTAKTTTNIGLITSGKGSQMAEAGGINANRTPVRLPASGN